MNADFGSNEICQRIKLKYKADERRNTRECSTVSEKYTKMKSSYFFSMILSTHNVECLPEVLLNHFLTKGKERERQDDGKEKEA